VDDPSKVLSSAPSSSSYDSSQASRLKLLQQQREADYSLYSKRPQGDMHRMSLGSDKESVFFQAYISKLF
jgi:hypothetical protein